MRIILPFVVAVLSSPVYAISIEGDARYEAQLTQCLDLLAKKANDDYQFITDYIGVIAQGNRSGMRAWENPPRYEMSDKTAFYSVTWCAGTIAHDAYHSYLFHKHKPANGGKTPYEKWGGFAAEREAIDFQIKVMKKIGASAHELNYLGTLDGTHGDTNKDGKLNSKDYEQRNW